MKIKSLSLAILALPLLVACEVPITQSFDEEVLVQLSMPPECAGTRTSTDNNGETTTSATVVGDNCEVTFSWSGRLLDMEQLAQKIEEQAGGVVKSVTLDEFTGSVTDMHLQNAAGATVDAPSMSRWALGVTIESEDFFDLDVTNVAEFLVDPIELETAQAILDLITDALEAKQDVNGAGTGTIVLPLSEYARLSQESGLALFIALDGKVTVTVSATER